MNMPYTLPGAEQNILAGKKIHTMREDKKGRWKAGRLIHHCTGLRSKAYKCFLQNVCTSTQTALMVYAKVPKGLGWRLHVTIDRKRLTKEQIELLFKNDGFEHYNAFRDWFFPGIAKGRYKKTMRKITLIHWTDFKY